MAADLEFRRAFLARVLAGATENVTGAGDDEWSTTRPWGSSRRSSLRDVATRLGLRRRRFDERLAAERLDLLLDEAAGLAEAWQRLDDDGSRGLMLDVLARRVLGAYHVALPVTPAAFQAVWQEMKARRVGSETIAGPAGHRLPLVEYGGLRMWADPAQLVAFELGQHPPAGAGEVVVDGGAGFGDTALVYAQQVGDEGHVVAVELDGDNLALIETNLALNPELSGRIRVVEGALWDEHGGEVGYEPRGGMSSVLGSGARARTVALDQLGLDRVDRIKLDVEGAEAHALRGGLATIARDRPRLAVSAYHRLDDLAVLPALIAELHPAYRLRLGHFTPGIAETMIFAEP